MLLVYAFLLRARCAQWVSGNSSRTSFFSCVVGRVFSETVCCLLVSVSPCFLFCFLFCFRVSVYSHLFCSDMLGGAPEIAVLNPKFRKRCFLLSFLIKMVLTSFLNAPGVRFRVLLGRRFQYLYIRCAKVYLANVLL